MKQVEFAIFGLLVISESLIVLAIIAHLFNEPDEEWGYLALAGMIIPFICLWLNERSKIKKG